MDKTVDFICWFSFDRGGPGFESFVWKLKKEIDFGIDSMDR